MSHDADGNLRNDNGSNIESMEWNIYGKAANIQTMFPTSGGPAGYIYFGYDGLGHRTYKSRVKGLDSGRLETATYFVREASGNILAEYNTAVEYDAGGYIKVISKLRKATSTLTVYLTALRDIGYLSHDSFTTYIFSHVAPDTGLYPIGYYMAQDPAMMQQMVLGGFGALRAMCNYTAATGKHPVGDALRASFSQVGATQPLMDITTAMFTNPDPAQRQHALLQLVQQVPDIYTTIAQQNQITVSSAPDSAMLFSIMDNTAVSNPGYFAAELDHLYTTDNSILDNWLNTFSADSLYSTNPWFTATHLTDLMNTAVVDYGDYAAEHTASELGTAKIEEGVFGFGSWWAESPDVLSTLRYDITHLDRIRYSDDPVTWLSGLHDLELLDTAMSKITGVDIIGLEEKLDVDVLTSSLEWRDPAIIKQEISLGNHHMYGSNRLGINNYFPGQFRNTWDYKSGLADTTRLGIPVPWYSYSHNDVMDTNKLDPYGAGLVHQMVAQHLLGQKQYEIVNHLGNVQEVISDKRYVKTTGNGARDYFNASIVAAYDYYPYGQLMPARFVSDTTPVCVTSTQTRLVEVRTVTPVLSSAYAIGGGSLGPAPAPPPLLTSGTLVSGPGGGMAIDIPVTAGVEIDLSASLTYLYGSFVTISVSEGTGSSFKLLKSINLNYPLWVSMKVKPSGTSIKFTAYFMSSYIAAPVGGLFAMGYVGYEKVSYTPQPVLVTLCSSVKDKYEFGYNTQMKMNEIAGTGNWNTAEYWEYNTRTAHRGNVDPEANLWESPYAVNGSNPILNSDPNGDCWNCTPLPQIANAFSNYWNSPNTNPYAKDLELIYGTKIETTGEMWMASFANSTNHVGYLALSTGGPNGTRSYSVNRNASKLQVGKYQDMKKVTSNTDKSADHIPSFGAMKTAKEMHLGRALTKAEMKELKNGTFTLVYETDIHRAGSRTYGGRNGKAKQVEDAGNLQAAVKKDIKAITPWLLKKGYSNSEINSATGQLLQKLGMLPNNTNNHREGTTPPSGTYNNHNNDVITLHH